MFAVDEAEARGDAEAALMLIEDHLAGPDGECFWKHSRLKRLIQVDLFGDILPGWVISRWILEQALFSMHEDRRGIWAEAEAAAVRARGGPGRVHATDFAARTQLTEQDWVFRQVALYDLGSLTHFLQCQATPDLIVGADNIQEWALAPMGGFELVSSDSRETTWRDLADGSERTGPNIGSAALIDVGECVIGRLVPIREGHIFETRPVRVPRTVALAVVAAPKDWVGILGETSDKRIVTTGLHHQCFDSDVPPVVWQTIVDHYGDEDLDDPTDPGFEPALARAVLATARHALRNEREGRSSGAVDVWPCLAAALLTPYVLIGFASAAGPPDVPTFLELALALPDPAASVCQGLAAEIARAA